MYELIGIWLFIVGSCVFLVSPIYDIFRAAEHFTEERKRTATLRETLSPTFGVGVDDMGDDAPSSPSP